LKSQNSNSIFNIDAVDWEVAEKTVPYPVAHARMKTRAAAIAAGDAAELIWLLEHPPLYTAGTSASPADLVAPNKFDVFETGRGGQYTYHGPGQRVGYAMLDLRKRGRDVAAFVRGLEQWSEKMGELSRHQHQRRSRPLALCGDCPLRNKRARRYEPCSLETRGVNGGRGRCS